LNSEKPLDSTLTFRFYFAWNAKVAMDAVDHCTLLLVRLLAEESIHDLLAISEIRTFKAGKGVRKIEQLAP
jgi:hypothetical protein